MNAAEFLKTEADPDDVIAITTYVDWELHHLTNIMEAYHQRKLESLTKIETAIHTIKKGNYVKSK